MGRTIFENTFAVEKLYKDTYRITDDALGIVHMYLLIGQDKALLIDSGYGNPKLLDVIRTLTDKQVICVCTHGHIDHALGAYLFDKAYLHSADNDVYRSHCSSEMLRSCGYNGIGAKPKRLLKTPGYRENVELLAAIKRRDLLPLEDMECFELGGRTVTWTLIPGHTHGSVAFLDEKNYTVFDGDAASNGVWLFMPEATSLEEYGGSLARYMKFCELHAIIQRYGGHANQPMPVADLAALRRLCDRVQKKLECGKHPGFSITFPIGKARMAFQGKTALFYRID